MKFNKTHALAFGILLFGATLAFGYHEGGRLADVAASGENAAAVATPSVRSSLYPADWFPGYADASGRYLQDFSYAGYRLGAEPPINPPGNTYDVTQSPYAADKTGAVDATAAIQKALDDAGKAGGGIVYVPAGTYKISITNGKGLLIKYNNVVLRGAGSGKTFIYDDTYAIRGANVITIAPSGLSMAHVKGTPTLLTKDLPYPTKQISVQSVAGFGVGDWVVLKFDDTDAFMSDIGMSGIWKAGDIGPMEFLRQVTAINAANNVITIDIPTRYSVKMRDNARIYVTDTPLQEVGIEQLSIGNREHPNESWDWGKSVEPSPEGTPAYEVANSQLFKFGYVANSWMRNVNTYKPSVNKHNYHAVSGIIALSSGTRSVTLQNVNIRNPQLLEAAQGYGFNIQGQENLIQNSSVSNARHGYSFWRPDASGNVLTNVAITGSKKNSEYHGRFSPSNLIDDVTLSSERLNAIYYPSGNTPPHGITTSQSVFWNIAGTGSISSNQFGVGFIIGTASGISVSTPVNTSRPNLQPKDFLEAVGKAGNLEPESLYRDQLARRLSSSTQPSCAIKASAATVAPGGSVTLAWSSKNARACTGKKFTTSAEEGSAAVTVATSTTYGLTCSNFDQAASCQVEVVVDPTMPPQDPAPTCSLKASPSTVEPGGKVTLAWSSTNATSCSGSAFSTGSSRPASGSAVVAPTASKTYGVTCGNATKSVSCTANVTVKGVPAPSCTITATPATVASGGKVTLTWSSNTGGGCGGKGFSTSASGYAASGSAVVKPTSSRFYGVSCKDSKGTIAASCETKVTVK